MSSPQQTVTTAFTVNGKDVIVTVEARRSLLDCIREDLRLRGTHVGCEHGVCGCCNVIMDGKVIRSCLTLAIQADGSVIETIESLEDDGRLSPLQEAFVGHHALQCGYCTPGVLITLTSLLDRVWKPTEEQIVEALAGNICRCTGYQQIIDAAKSVVESRPDHRPPGGTASVS